MQNLTSLTNRVSIVTGLLILTFCLAILAWDAHAHAAGELQISDPGPLTQKQTFKVTDAGRVFDPVKFTKVETQPAGIVSIPPHPLANDGVFEVTPINSGKTTLTIEYTDGATILKGTRELFVPYSQVQVDQLGDQPVKLFSGQNKDFEISGVDLKGNTVRIDEAGVRSSNEDALRVDFTDHKLNLHGQGAGSAEIGISVLQKSYGPVKVQVTEGITKIEIDNQGAVSSGDVQVTIPEGESRKFKLRIVGSRGTEFKRSAVPLETTVEPPDPAEVPSCGVPVQATYDDKNENTLNVTVPALTGCPSANRSIKLKIPKGDFAETDKATSRIKIAVTQKIGFIRLTSSSPILGQNGRITINAQVFNSSNVLVPLPPDVEFTLRDPDKNGIWVSLVKEGNQATLVSRNPSQKEIRDKNDNELVNRPSEIVVIAKARLNSESPAIEGSIIIGLAEVVGFDLLKVKLNIMDERTASDLYGKVTSDEYYVLTVRLFNNLKNERTQKFEGNSIIAYSSSIEVAVGLEKRFDPGTASYFPYVIKGSDAKQIAKENAGKAAALLKDRFAKENEAITTAQTNLKDVVDKLYAARQDVISKLNEALKKKVRAEELTAIARSTVAPNQRGPAFDKANDAITEYNDVWVEAQVALRAANDLEEQVSNSRRILAHRVTELGPIRQDLTRLTDPDTVIDDGLWHPLTPADLNRLNPMPAPSPTDSEVTSASGPMALLTEAEFRGRPERAFPKGSLNEAPPPESEDQDPPCAGVITYRPFTFEMMVNTVDRRDDRSRRSKIFKVLDFIGTGTSFVTSVAVPGSSSDLPLGLEKFRNLLLPGLDKMFPNPKEQQRQNIVSQAMKTIEEIPFGSDITRVIFIPKRNIHGLVRGHEVRISDICPYFFRIQVAIVSKNATVEQGTIKASPQ